MVVSALLSGCLLPEAHCALSSLLSLIFVQGRFRLVGRFDLLYWLVFHKHFLEPGCPFFHNQFISVWLRNERGRTAVDSCRQELLVGHVCGWGPACEHLVCSWSFCMLDLFHRIRCLRLLCRAYHQVPLVWLVPGYVFLNHIRVLLYVLLQLELLVVQMIKWIVSQFSGSHLTKVLDSTFYGQTTQASILLLGHLFCDQFSKHILILLDIKRGGRTNQIILHGAPLHSHVTGLSLLWGLPPGRRLGALIICLDKPLLHERVGRVVAAITGRMEHLLVRRGARSSKQLTLFGRRLVRWLRRVQLLGRDEVTRGQGLQPRFCILTCAFVSEGSLRWLYLFRWIFFCLHNLQILW